jgi:hypothetical protein
LNNTTRAPKLASSRAPNNPAGPAPMTATKNLLVTKPPEYKLHNYNSGLIIAKKNFMDKTSQNLHIKLIFSCPDKCRILLEIG